MHRRIRQVIRLNRIRKASLTVEAALVLPVFLFFMIAFLYFIQIFTIQEQIQAGITKMGLNLSRSSYLLKDFPSRKEAFSFDVSLFGEEYNINFSEFAEETASQEFLKRYSKLYLDSEQINKSCIKDGFDGLAFTGSSLFDENEYIDIIVNYTAEMPVKIFILPELHIVQRERLRCWTGYEVEAVYQTEEDQNDNNKVYIADTGTVYHKSENCSHIKLSITVVQGVPKDLRNDNGAKYYPCESCVRGKIDSLASYYITSDGTRYHSKRECSRIKRSVKKILSTEVGKRTPCKRCYN